MPHALFSVSASTPRPLSARPAREWRSADICPRMIMPRISSSVTSFTLAVPTIWPFFMTTQAIGGQMHIDR